MLLRRFRALILCVAWLALLVAAATPQPTQAAAPVLRVRVGGPGVVAVSAAQLIEAGWGGIDPRLIQVRRGGAELAVFTAGQDDGRLDAADQLRWIAGDGGRWSVEEVYTLTVGEVPGARLAQPPASDAPLYWEEDAVYLPSASTRRGDRWFGRELRAPGGAVTIALTLPAPLPSSQAIELHLSTLTPRRHRLFVRAFSSNLGSAEWVSAPADSGRPRQVTFTTTRPLPAGLVTLALQLDGADGADLVLIDRVTVPGLRVALPEPPVVLESVPAVSLPTGADYLIVTHRAFRPALEPLIAVRQSQGLRVAVMDIADIYTQFSGGERDPEAIRSLLSASRHWSPAPRSLLLVGGGSTRVRAAGVDGGFIPPYLIDADPELGEIPCDTCLARLDAGDVRLDAVPELAVGRFPALTLDEARSMVAKSVANLNPPGGEWLRRVLAVSDNDVEADGTLDPAGSFVAELDAALAHLPPTAQVQRFHYDPTQPSSATRSTYRTPGELRQALFPAFDAGAGLLVYAGHASPWQWAYTAPSTEPSYLLSVYDVARANGERLPILIDLTCLSGQWSNPARRSLDELLVVQSGGGVVAALAPAGTATNTGHRRMAAAAMPALVAGQTVGEAHLAAIHALAASGTDRDLLYSYNLLGDPEARLAQETRQTGSRLFLPLLRQ
jgi:hypothetical protein